MRISSILVVAAALAAASPAQAEPPRLQAAAVSAAPWSVQSGGISACEVAVSSTGAVEGVEIVQDVPPYGEQLRDDIRASWTFEPAREGGRPAGSRVLVLGFFMPPMLAIPKPENPLYKSTQAPESVPWPTNAVAPAYPVNVRGGAKVILEVDVSDQGAVTGSRVLTPASGFDGSAQDAVRQWTFRPAAQGGRPVTSRAFFVVSYPVVTP
jgi:TonB family protein